MRLHSAVLATCAGVPPILVGYCDKCADFMESMELMDWHVDAHLMTLGKLAGLAATMIDSASALRPTIVERASAWRGRLREYARNV